MKKSIYIQDYFNRSSMSPGLICVNFRDDIPYEDNQFVPFICVEKSNTLILLQSGEEVTLSVGTMILQYKMEGKGRPFYDIYTPEMIKETPALIEKAPQLKETRKRKKLGPPAFKHFDF